MRPFGGELEEFADTAPAFSDSSLSVRQVLCRVDFVVWVEICGQSNRFYDDGARG
jgi:hypothetical protein